MLWAEGKENHLVVVDAFLPEFHRAALMRHCTDGGWTMDQEQYKELHSRTVQYIVCRCQYPSS